MTLYITSISFEDRCLALAADLESGSEQRRVAVLDFGGYESVDPYLLNRARFVERIKKAGVPLEVLPVSLSLPLDGERKLRGVVAEAAPARVVLDVSTLPRNYLFSTCRLLCEMKTRTAIRYYKPETYGGQLSRGVRHVQSVPGFEGAAVGGGSTVLVLILGFEGYKSLYAWEEMGASRTILLLGDPPYRGDFLDTARRNNGELFRQLGERGEIGQLHTFDMATAHGQLLRLYERLVQEDRNTEVTLCPLGTKPQSIAAFALAYCHPEVAIAYVSSLMYYTGDYSRGYDRHYVEVSLQSLLARDVDPGR